MFKLFKPLNSLHSTFGRFPPFQFSIFQYFNISTRPLVTSPLKLFKLLNL